MYLKTSDAKTKTSTRTMLEKKLLMTDGTSIDVLIDESYTPDKSMSPPFDAYVVFNTQEVEWEASLHDLQDLETAVSKTNKLIDFVLNALGFTIMPDAPSTKENNHE